MVADSFLGSRLTGGFGARVTAASGLFTIAVGVFLTRITPEGGYPDVLLPGFVLMGLGVRFSAVASTTGGTSALITLILIHAKATGDSESRALAKSSRQ